MEQLQDWLWLTTLKGLSLQGQKAALSYFGSPREAFLAGQGAISQVPGLSPQERDALDRKDLRMAEGVMEDCERNAISILTFDDPRYPWRLKNIDTPPLVLYYQGEFLPFDDLPVVTVVGARAASGYGLTSARKLGSQLGASGATVVSGAAKGIDSQALEGALSQGAKVAAVLGNGLDVIYPTESKRLYEEVRRHGCLLSEFTPGTRPLAWNFPQRNRIMSGLSLGVLVIEATKKSGSLITATLALEQGRDVFAIPGNIDLPACEGSNALIQEGAGLVTCGWDILKEYVHQFPELHPAHMQRDQRGNQNHRGNTAAPSPQTEKVEKAPDPEQKSEKKSPPESENKIDNREKRDYIDLLERERSLTEDEKKLVLALGKGQRHVDDLIEETTLAPAKVLASLTLLEVKGYVTQLPGKRFQLKQ